jgi:hypothetical protein
MIRDLIPWNTLTRTGIPPLKVSRRDLVLGEVIVPVGETLDPELLPMQIRRERLRQFYEQRRLEPVNPPADSRQFFREQLARAQGQEVPITPLQPVASQIVADLPAVEVPDLDYPAKRKPKGAK